MINKLISESITQIKKKDINVYSYSIYYSHEDREISIFVDTLLNSRKRVREQISGMRELFDMEIENGDYDILETSSPIGGRNFSLGDYAYRRLTTVKYQNKYTKKFILNAIKTLIKREGEIACYSRHKGDLLFSVTSLIDEFGISWYRKFG